MFPPCSSRILSTRRLYFFDMSLKMYINILQNVQKPVQLRSKRVQLKPCSRYVFCELATRAGCTFSAKCLILLTSILREWLQQGHRGRGAAGSPEHCALWLYNHFTRLYLATPCYAFARYDCIISLLVSTLPLSGVANRHLLPHPSVAI